MDRLRGRVHNLSSELTNIDRQMQISGAIVSELDIQVAAMGTRIDKTTENLIVAEDALAEKRAILGHRLTEINKRGPLHTFQVLLAAESFGDLLSRYKYQDGLAYYESTRDVASHFFIDYLPKGTYVFEYPSRIVHRGQYQTGLTELQCMYAPEFNSHAPSQQLTVR